MVNHLRQKYLLLGECPKSMIKIPIADGILNYPKKKTGEYLIIYDKHLALLGKYRFHVRTKPLPRLSRIQKVYRQP